MNIGIDLRSLQDTNKAGVGNYTWQLTKEIIKNDQRNKYWFFFNSFKAIALPEFLENMDVKHLRIPAKLFKLSTLLFKYPKMESIHKTDLVWQPSFNFINLNTSTKLVVTVHDLSFMINKKWYSHKMWLWHYLQNIKKILIRSDSIITVSENTKQDIIYFFKIPDSKIEVIKSGYNFDSNPQGNLDKMPDKYFVYLGTIEPRKNICSIIEAMEYLYQSNEKYLEYKLVLIGGPGWRNKNIFNRIKKSKYKDNILYLGYVNENYKNFILKNSLGLIWPSFYEGYSFPPLEAAFYNKPIITSFAASIPEIIGDRAIMINPYNVRELAMAISNIIKMSALGLKQSSIPIDEDQFSWQKIAHNYINLFNKVYENRN